MKKPLDIYRSIALWDGCVRMRSLFLSPVRCCADRHPGAVVGDVQRRLTAGAGGHALGSALRVTVTFGAAQTVRTFTVTATVSLADDDSSGLKVAMKFDTGIDHTVCVRESIWPSRITLSLDQRPLRHVTIPLVVTHLGGATAADYKGIPASVTFRPRQRRVGFVVYGVLDQQIETGEGLRIDFGTPLPPGVSVSSWRSYETVEFVDNFRGGTSRAR